MHCFITFVKLALLRSNNRPDSPGSCSSSFIVRLHDMSSPPHLILAASDAVQFWSMLVSENVFVSSTRPPEKINKAVQSSGARHDSKSVTRINFVVLIFPLKRGDRSWPLSLHVTHWMSPLSFVFFRNWLFFGPDQRKKATGEHRTTLKRTKSGPDA